MIIFSGPRKHIYAKEALDGRHGIIGGSVISKNLPFLRYPKRTFTIAHAEQPHENGEWRRRRDYESECTPTYGVYCESD